MNNYMSEEEIIKKYNQLINNNIFKKFEKYCELNGLDKWDSFLKIFEIGYNVEIYGISPNTPFKLVEVTEEQKDKSDSNTIKDKFRKPTKIVNND